MNLKVKVKIKLESSVNTYLGCNRKRGRIDDEHTIPVDVQRQKSSVLNFCIIISFYKTNIRTYTKIYFLQNTLEKRKIVYF